MDWVLTETPGICDCSKIQSPRNQIQCQWEAFRVHVLSSLSMGPGPWHDQKWERPWNKPVLERIKEKFKVTERGTQVKRYSLHLSMFLIRKPVLLFLSSPVLSSCSCSLAVWKAYTQALLFILTWYTDKTHG